MKTLTPFSILQQKMSDINQTPKTIKSYSITTGIISLDSIIGNIISGPLYLFYSSKKSDLQNRILYNILIEMIKTGKNTATHIICGNNRNLSELANNEKIIQKIERAGLTTEALKKIYIIHAFSQSQTSEAIAKTIEKVETEPSNGVVTIQNIENLYSKSPVLSKLTQELYKKDICNLVEHCRARQIPIIASASASNQGRPIPVPEGGESLAQLAKVSIYLRAQRSGGATAYIFDHYEKNKIGSRIDLSNWELQTRNKDSRNNRYTKNILKTNQ